MCKETFSSKICLLDYLSTCLKGTIIYLYSTQFYGILFFTIMHQPNVLFWVNWQRWRRNFSLFMPLMCTVHTRDYIYVSVVRFKLWSSEWIMYRRLLQEVKKNSCFFHFKRHCLSANLFRRWANIDSSYNLQDEGEEKKIIWFFHWLWEFLWKIC